MEISPVFTYPEGFEEFKRALAEQNDKDMQNGNNTQLAPGIILAKKETDSAVDAFANGYLLALGIY